MGCRGPPRAVLSRVARGKFFGCNQGRHRVPWSVFSVTESCRLGVEWMKREITATLLLTGLSLAGCSSGPPEFQSSAQMIEALNNGIIDCEGISMEKALEDDYGFGQWGPMVAGAQPFACGPESDDLTVMLVPQAPDSREILASYCAELFLQEGALPSQYGYKPSRVKRVTEFTAPLLVGKNWAMRTLLRSESFPPNLDTAKVEKELGARLTTVGQECSAFTPEELDGLFEFQ